MDDTMRQDMPLAAYPGGWRAPFGSSADPATHPLLDEAGIHVREYPLAA